MNCRDLRDFLALLQTAGELRTIEAAVSPLLEIAAVTDRVSRADGTRNTALLFNEVTGHSYRVAANLFGSEKRLAMALGLPLLAGLGDRFAGLLATVPGTTAAEKLAALPTTPAWQSVRPVTINDCELLECPAELSVLPLLKNNPRDGAPDHDGRFLTLPLVITASPDFADGNCGIYRAAPVDNRTLAVCWSENSGAAAHEQAWRATGKPMPVAIALGGPPALTFAASLPLPLDELTFAGLLRAEPLAVSRTGNGLTVPSGAEAVIEGYLLPEPVGSGAFGNHTGGYTPSGPAAAVRVTSLRLRPDLIMPASIVGRPPMEDCWLARGWGYLLLALLQIDFPALTGLHLPFSGIFHGAAVFAVRNAAGTGKELLAALGKTPWLTSSRLLVLVDSEQDPTDEAGVAWRIINNVDWSIDLAVDGQRLTIDATRKPGSREPVVADPEIATMIEKRWKEYGFDW